MRLDGTMFAPTVAGRKCVFVVFRAQGTCLVAVSSYFCLKKSKTSSIGAYVVVSECSVRYRIDAY